MNIKLWRHYIGAIVIMLMMSGLFAISYSGVKNYYGFRETYKGNDNNMTMTDKINSLEVVEGLNNFQSGVTNVFSPNSKFDIIGGIALLSFGALRFLFGLITFPVEMFGVITNFYIIPSPIAWGISILVTLYLVFILVSFKRSGGEI